MKTWAVVLLVGLLAVPVVGRAGDLTDATARDWMSMNRTNRVVYVAGFLNGARSLLKVFEMDMRGKDGSITIDDLEEQLYRRLVNEPELRNGRISDILYGMIDRLMVLTDKEGHALDSKQPKTRYQ